MTVETTQTRNFKKTFRDALSCRVACQSISQSQEIFVTSAGDLKLNSNCGDIYRKKRLCSQGDSSNAFPVKCFVQCELILSDFTAGFII